MSRPTACLHYLLQKQLNMYALAASAAGVGLAGPQPAEAKIVYTAATVVLTGYNPLDLNHDGINDFYLGISSFSFGTFGRSTLIVEGRRRGNSVVLRNGYAGALRAGVRVGGQSASAKFGPVGYMAERGFRCVSQNNCKTTFRGPWANGGKGVKNRYLGFRFLIDGQTNYGWARLNVGPEGVGGVLTGYAYETIPNKPIVTGKTKGRDETNIEESNATPANMSAERASLGALAMGAPGLSIWKRESVGAPGQQPAGT